MNGVIVIDKPQGFTSFDVIGDQGAGSDRQP